MPASENEKNFSALNSFAHSLRNKLTPNSEIYIANANIKYSWSGSEKEIDTKIMISLNRHPHASLSIEEKDWLDADTMYIEFLTGYNEFYFDDETCILTFKCNSPSKLGARYNVEFKEM